MSVPNCSGDIVWSNGSTNKHIVVGTTPAAYTAYCKQNYCKSNYSLPFYINNFKPNIFYDSTACINPGGNLLLTAQNCTSTPSWSTGQNTQSITLSNITNPQVISLICNNGSCPNGTKTVTVAPIVNIGQNESNTIKKVYGNSRINSSGKIIPFSNVNYIAGKSITLQPGFEARAGTNFKALIGGCSN